MSANLPALTRAVHGAVETVIRIPENAASGAEADRIRDELSGRGITIEDTPGGTVWHR